MLKKKNILILFGGGGTEHDVSRTSADYINDQLKSKEELNPILVEINKEIRDLYERLSDEEKQLAGKDPTKNDDLFKRHLKKMKQAITSDSD